MTTACRIRLKALEFRLGPEVAAARIAWHRLLAPLRTRLLSVASRISRSSLRIDSPAVGFSFEPPSPLEPYDAWLEVNELNERRRSLLRANLDCLVDPPLLSVVMVVADERHDLLDRTIGSVVDQIYERWELRIATGASSAAWDLLADWEARDARIAVILVEDRGDVAGTTNASAALAKGEYLAFLDPGDELELDALAEIVLHASADRPFDILYTDDDEIDLHGRRFAPRFKPDWSPELLLSTMYLARLLVVRRRLFEQVGGMRAGFEESPEHDLVLRLTERTDRVAHLPRVLYHRRARQPTARVRSRAVLAAFVRRGVEAVAFEPEWARSLGAAVVTHRFPDDGPRVAVLVPTRNRLELLAPCIESLRVTSYRNYEVVVVDNESDDPATVDYLARSPVRVLRVATGGQFNFAQLVNEAVAAVDAEYVLLLNNDTEVLRADWLSQMVGYLGLEGVGAVGARLLFPDGRIQHAGVIHGLAHGLAGHAFTLSPGTDSGYLAYAKLARNYSAVTGACLLVRRDLFLELGGLDSERFAVSYNDVDFCYRLVDAGHRVVYCPDAELLHHEGASRGLNADPAAPAAFRALYGNRRDPYYNPNLSLEHERFPIGSRTRPPRHLRPVRTAMCIPDLDWGPEARSQFELTVRLRDDGVISAAVYSPTDGPLRGLYEGVGIEVVVAPPPPAAASGVATNEEQLAHVVDRLRGWNAELVYAYTGRMFYAVGAAQRAGIPSIWSLRESGDWRTVFDFDPPELASRALECFAYPYCVVFAADATRDAWSALDVRRNAITIPDSLDVARFRATLVPRGEARVTLGVSPDVVVALSVGTVNDREGQLRLVDAVQRISVDVAARLRLCIVGDLPGPYSGELHGAVERLEDVRRSCFSIVPATFDTGLYYSAADLFVSVSPIESYSYAALEAMASGLPVVMPPVRGVGHEVSGGVNALTYDSGEPRALADALVRLVEDARERARLARNSPTVLAALPDYDAMIRGYSSVFREAWLSGRSRGTKG